MPLLLVPCLFVALAFVSRPAVPAPAPVPAPDLNDPLDRLEWREHRRALIDEIETAKDQLAGHQRFLQESEGDPKGMLAVEFVRPRIGRLNRLIAELEQKLADLEKRH
jgi:hypothetical protein